MTTPNTSSVFLVSGGAKGITAQCVVHMAKRYKSKFVLLGRSALAESEPAWARGITAEAALKKQAMTELQSRGEKPTPPVVQKMVNQVISQREITDTLQAIRQAGGQAEYLSVDITDSQTLQDALPSVTQRFGAITGIIHGAGALADKLIEKKTEQDFELVYATKIAGLESLLQAIPPSQLTHLVLFSSVAGFFGNAAQADYAMANEILNKSAYVLKQQYPRCHVVSINWGPWDGGMVTPELKRAFADRGIEVIPVAVGTRMLVDEFLQPDQAVQTVVGNGLAGVQTPLDATLRHYQIHRKLTEIANPFLRDHIIAGRAVLPTTCALAWMANLAEQLYPGYQATRFADLRVLKGIVFDDTLADEYVIELRELSKQGQVVFEVKIFSQDKGRARYHYSVQITLTKVETRHALSLLPAISLPNLAKNNPIAGASLYQNKALFHGPLFQGVTEVLSYSRDHLTMACRLPKLRDQEQGQFALQTVNPFMTDVMLQSMVVWVSKFHEAGSLPLSCQQGEYLRPLPFETPFYVTLTVRESNDMNLTADIVACDEQGQLYARLMGAKVTISKRLNQLTGMA